MAAPSNWTAVNGARLNLTDDRHSGKSSLDVQRGTNNAAALSDPFALMAGSLYKVTVWGKYVRGDQPQVILTTHPAGVHELAMLPANSPVFAERAGYFVAQSTGNYHVELRLNGAGAHHRSESRFCVCVDGAVYTSRKRRDAVRKLQSRAGRRRAGPSGYDAAGGRELRASLSGRRRRFPWAKRR